ncbi:hypothetical protein [Priestia megaterium]|uniref:hypothetical protein n=1 Tax=Priestia megaterium TaxID=1404 RepID=UPI001BE85CD7|nr:hypothetical protein [Priestia megaterium]MBT2278259.1 hypothetical protein [Priestia megaterium]
MNSEMHFLPTMYSQDHHQLQHADERFIGRPFGFGGYGYGGYPYGGFGGYGYGFGGCC